MIRLARQEDIPAIGRLLYQVQATHAELRPDIFKMGQRKYEETELFNLLLDDTQPILVAELDDQVVGYVMCQFQEVVNHQSLLDRKVLFIDDLCVAEGRRGQGLGQALYAAAVALAKENRCQSVTLNVWEDNLPALQFYQKLGLKTLKRVMEEPIDL